MLAGNLKLWLRGDDLTASHVPDSGVALWPDASGAGHDAVALNGTHVEPWFALGNLPAVRFRPTPYNELMKAAGLYGGALPTDLTIVAVYETRENFDGMRPVGFGAYTDGSTADNFNLAADPSIRKDNAWHLVSAAFDPDADTVRFTLDGDVETVTGTGTTPVAVDGPLMVGAHYTSDVVDSAFDGLIDELRISGRVVPLDQLLDRGGLIFRDGFESGTTEAW